ncbi:MAG: tetratricopeptide repeat protein, partial [Planctomycetota bacterium]
MFRITVASWFPSCLKQAIGSIAPASVPALAAATGTVAWPVAAGVACLGSLVWLSRWEGRRQNAELNSQLQDYFQSLLQAQAGSRDQILEAIREHADKLPESLPLDEESTERLAALAGAVQQLQDEPTLTEEQLDDALAEAVRPLLQGHAQTQQRVADALLEARERFDGLDEALAGISEDLAAAAQSIKGHIASDGQRTRDKLDELKQEIADTAELHITQARAIDRLTEQLDAAQDRAEQWRGRYESAIARQVEAERAKGVPWREAVASIREAGPAAVLAFLRSEAPDDEARADQAELYAEMYAAAMAAVDYPAAEDAARLRSAMTPDDAAAWNQYGFVLYTRGQYEPALVAFREAERIFRLAFGDDHPNVARNVNNIGGVLKERGDLEGALSAFREAERIFRLAFGDDHPNVAIHVNNIGGVLKERGDLEGALSAYREAERIDRAAFGDDHPNVAIRVNNIGSVLESRGDLEGALSAYREAERIFRLAFGDDHPNVAVDVNNIGSVLKERGDLEGALSSFHEAERIDRAAFGDDHPNVAIRVNNIGSV